MNIFHNIKKFEPEGFLVSKACYSNVGTKYVNYIYSKLLEQLENDKMRGGVDIFPTG